MRPESVPSSMCAIAEVLLESLYYNQWVNFLGAIHWKFDSTTKITAH